MRQPRVGEQSRLDEPDYYDILQVSPKANLEVIHAAYRVLARDAHPDRNSDADANRRIVRINTAYGVLGDREQRARYDLQRTRWARSARAARLARSTSPVAARPVSQRPSRAMHDVERRAPALSSRALVALALATALAILLMAFIWVTFDGGSDDVDGTATSYQTR